MSTTFDVKAAAMLMDDQEYHKNEEEPKLMKIKLTSAISATTNNSRKNVSLYSASSRRFRRISSKKCFKYL